MNIQEKEILIAIVKKKRSNNFLKGFFIAAAVWVLLYQFILLDIPAKNDFCYDLGVIVNTLALSYVTGYIFYFLTVLLPEENKYKEMQPIVKLKKNELSKQLGFLMVELFHDKNWMQMDHSKTKEHFDNLSKDRRIWNEESTHLCVPSGEFILYRPKSLEVLHSTIENINFLFEDIIKNANYFDIVYLQNVLWVKNSRQFSRLKTYIPDSIEAVGDVSMAGDTLLDNFFNQELSLLLRITTPDEDSNNEPFLDKVKYLYSMGLNI